MKDLSIVLPCYNESGNLQEILRRYRELRNSLSFELILVDNGSTDGTAQVLAEELRKPENQFARTVLVPKNVGYGHGIQEGLRASEGAVLAFSHADLQCSPEDLLTAMVLYRQSVDKAPALVKGCRRGHRPFLDRLVTWFYNHLAAWILGLRGSAADPSGKNAAAITIDVNAEPKMFPKSLLPDLLAGPKDFTFDLYVLYAAKMRRHPIREFDVKYQMRQWGRSKLAANPWVRFLTMLRAVRCMVRLRCSGWEGRTHAGSSV